GRVAGIDVIGLDLSFLNREAGEGIAREGGGSFRLARNLDELAASFWRARRAQEMAAADAEDQARKEAAAQGKEPGAPKTPAPAPAPNPMPYDLGRLKGMLQQLQGLQ